MKLSLFTDEEVVKLITEYASTTKCFDQECFSHINDIKDILNAAMEMKIGAPVFMRIVYPDRDITEMPKYAPNTLNGIVLYSIDSLYGISTDKNES